MSNYEQEFQDTKAFIFNYTEVMFPVKDYDLQVYYLFAEFMAYIEQKDAKTMLEYMRDEYLKNGNENLFDKIASKFQLDEKYRYNYDLLHETAKLPLKLLLYQSILELLKYAVVERKQVFILAEGKSTIVLNQIKQTEWHGLEKYLKIYFTEEYKQDINLTLKEIIMLNNLNESAFCYMGKNMDFISKKYPKLKTYAISSFF